MAVLSNTGIRGGASGVVADPVPYTVKRSTRFNDDDASYLSRTPGTVGNKKKWTLSWWMKNTKTNDFRTIFMGYSDGNNRTQLSFDGGIGQGTAGDTLTFFDITSSTQTSIFQTTRLFRDVSAWYHCVLIVDVDNSTTADKVQLWVNGERADFSTYNAPTGDLWVNTTNAHLIGQYGGSLTDTANAHDGYLADIHLIDGTAKAATDFGKTDSTTGQWVPKEYEGTYGTNGFHLAMDPANGGTNYSQYVGTIRNSDPHHQAFNGLSSNGAVMNTGPFTWNGSLTGVTSMKIRCRPSGTTVTATTTLTVSGTGISNLVIPGDEIGDLKTITVNSTSVSNLSIATSNSGELAPGISQLEVNGKVLVDHTAIGYDSSGNANHWHENNLFGREHTVSNDNFKVVTYTGTAATQAITGVGFQPDLVWLKRIDGTGNHNIQDVVRGAAYYLQSDANSAQSNSGSRLASFDTDGFTLTSDNGGNTSGGSYVAWCWKAGGAASSNSDGSGTSSVSANPDAGFSIVKYTGTGASATWGHGLGKEPEFIIIKDLDGTNDWNVYHKEVGYSKAMKLNDNSIPATPGAARISATSSTTFTTGSAAGETNASGTDYIAYCFAPIDGHSQFSKFTHNTEMRAELGFYPALWIVKRTDAASGLGDGWGIFDEKRSNFDNPLWAQDAGTGGSGWAITQNPNGFTWGSGSFTSGDYVTMAWAGSPAGGLDLLADTPASYDNELNGGGNYCTLNSLNNAGTLSNGNLVASFAAGGEKLTTGTIGVQSGKWYWEVKKTGGSYGTVGIANSQTSTASYVGQTANSWGMAGADGNKYTNGSGSAYGNTWGSGDIVGIAFDADAGNLYFYKNGTVQNSGTAAFTGLTSDVYFPAVGNQNFDCVCNFGQRPFAYTPPTGYKALNTYNLSDPTITKGNTGFEAKIYTGNHSTVREVTYEFGPDLFWSKRRDDSNSHNLYDSVRGDNKYLQPDSAGAEGTDSGACVFGTDKVTLSTTRSNENGVEFGTWAWDAGTATVTNDASSTGVGTIDSTYRVNTNTGFSIVTAESVSTANEVMSIAHGLNAKPSFIIGKDIDHSNVGWSVQHSSLTAQYKLDLNGTSAKEDNANHWADTEPTSTLLYTKAGSWNYTSSSMVFYCWSEVAGYSKFGSYTGNASTDGPFVWCGFKPAFWMSKRTDSGAAWKMFDSARSPSNVVDDKLEANATTAEQSGSWGYHDFTSNGVKIRTSDADFNASGGSYIFIAFAESPFKYNNAH